MTTNFRIYMDLFQNHPLSYRIIVHFLGVLMLFLVAIFLGIFQIGSSRRLLQPDYSIGKLESENAFPNWGFVWEEKNTNKRTEPFTSLTNLLSLPTHRNARPISGNHATCALVGLKGTRNHPLKIPQTSPQKEAPGLSRVFLTWPCIGSSPRRPFELQCEIPGIKKRSLEKRDKGHFFQEQD